MTARAIKKLAKQKIAEGKNRSETANEIREETGAELNKIAKIVKGFVPIQSRKKYSIVNTVLAVLLILTGLLKALAIIGLLSDAKSGLLIFALLIGPGINIAMAVGVLRYAPSIYNVILILSGLSVVRSIQNISNFDSWVIIDYSLIGVIMILAGVLMAKLNSAGTIKKTTVQAEDGSQKTKNILVFSDPITPSTDTLDDSL